MLADSLFQTFERTHHHRIAERHFTEGIEEMKSLRGNKVLRFGRVCTTKSCHGGLFVHNLAR